MASQNQNKESKNKVSKSGSRGSSQTRSRASGRNTSAGDSGSREGMSVTGNDEFRVSDDIKIISGFVIMILLMLSNFHVIGRVGDYISHIMFGLFGLFAYVAPILIFAAICFFIANFGNRSAAKKLIAAIILYIMLSTILQLIYSMTETGYNLVSIYKKCAKIRNGGGFTGGIFAALLHHTIGIYGAFIVTFGIIIICVVIISEKSFVGSVKKHSRNAYDTVKEDARRMRQNSEIRQERREQRKMRGKLERAKKTVRGVNLYSRVTEGTEVDSDVHELVKSGALYRGHINLDDSDEEEMDENSYYSSVTSRYGKTYEEDLMDDTDSSSLISDINKIWNYAEERNEKDVISQAEKEKQEKDIRNGEFQPKERIHVSKSALEIMNAAAYTGESTKAVKDIPNDIPVPNVNEGVREKAVSSDKVSTGMKSKEYVMPPLRLLRKGAGFKNTQNSKRGKISETAMKLQQTLDAFGVKASVVNESRGPSVTRYELQPETGTKVSKITSLSDDIKLNLAASDIRIEAPIPGKAAVGIEVPNEKRESVFLRDLIESEELSKHPSKLAFAAGMDIAGKVIVADIAKMPHMLIAGTTGSGKSVFTNSIIMSILFRAKPTEVKLIIVDPKVVEFGVYNGIPHLLAPVVTDPRKAAGALNWAVAEMSERYKLFANYNVRDLKGYNEKLKQMNYMDGDKVLEPKPQIVIIIDELADLMMVAAKEVEGAICRLAQLARAAGIHLIIATQRPSVDVVTGLIKANIPSRVALLVSSGTDSRTIIDCNGGEKLLGNGDMLFYPSGYVKPVRLQGAFVSDEEVQNVVSFLIDNNQDVKYDDSVTNAEVDTAAGGDAQPSSGGDDKDVLFEQAARFVIEKEKGSTSMLQRMFKIGFNRAARIIDQLEKAGVVGADEGTKPRKVLMSIEEFEQTQS